MNNNPTAEKISARFGEDILKTETFRDELTVTVKKNRIVEIMTYLRDDADLKYDYLVDLTAVDFLKMDMRPRFHVVYHLRSMSFGRRVRIHVPVAENECTIASVCGLWRTANWAEREAYEMYGIIFDGHPDLRRLLIPDTFTDYPLRKDYPLRGKGEREIVLPEGS